MKERIGFIGLGIMGMPMARNLLKAGFSVTVYNRTPARAEQMVREGARQAATLQELAEAASVIITMVTDTPDVRGLILGDNALIEHMQAGTVIIDMSTISPQVTRDIAERLRERGFMMLDAPVSGGEQGAINGTLSIMAGGEVETFKRCLPVLEAMGKNIVHAGPNGAGQTVKLVNQILVAGTLNAVAEALVFAQKQGVDVATAIDAVKAGAAGSWQLANLGPRMVTRDFRPGFMVDLMQKDLRLVMEAAESAKAALPGTSLVHQLLRSLQAAGEGRSGTQALVKVIERLSGIEPGEPPARPSTSSG